jgi:phage gp29-like protein
MDKDMADTDKKELTTEVATVRRDITMPHYSNVLVNQDDTLITRGGNKGLKIYDEIERDTKVFSSLQKRKLAVIGRPWQVDPASDRARDKAAAEMVSRNLSRIGFDTVTLNGLDAIMKGFAVGEIMWAVEGREYVIKRIIPRNQRRFTFDLDYKLRMFTLENQYEGITLPERKFIVHSYGGKDGSPFGLGLGTRLFWPAFFKRQDISAWLVFLDKFASPTAVGSYPPGASAKDIDSLRAALEAIAQETSIAIPDGMLIKFIEAQRSGGSDAYERMARYMDEQIEEVIIGDSSGQSGGGALAAAAITKKEVRIELVKADADLYSDTLSETLCKWLVELNMPGAGIPRVSRIVEEPANQKETSEVDKNMKEAGFRRTLKSVHETYGGEWEIIPVAPTAAAVKQGGAPEFAEADISLFPDQLALDAAIDATELQPVAVRLLQPLIDALNSAASFEDAYNALSEAYPKMDTKALADLLARAEFVAQLAGRQSVLDEIDA